MRRHIYPRTRLQKKLYLIYTLLYQILFGLNDDSDYPDNHNIDVHYPLDFEIARGVRFITKNHDLINIHETQPAEPIVIGEHCWIGHNAIILPGVVLGEHTVVGAGSVVTKSFPDGWCVVVGNPAKIIRSLLKKGDE